MTKAKEKAEQLWEQFCSEASSDFDIPIYEDMPLPMTMVQGWFNDQWECFELFRKELSDEEQAKPFTNERHFKSVEKKYKKLWDGEAFKKLLPERRKMGTHRRLSHLAYKNFYYWIEHLLKEVTEAGGLELMLKSLGTVEKAHDRFKRLYVTKPVRLLSAADAARILARYGYLNPEDRPLLARGALSGAAVLLKDDPEWANVEDMEKKYRDKGKRIALEEKASRYIDETDGLTQFGKWKMEIGESLFCKVYKRLRESA